MTSRRAVCSEPADVITTSVPSGALPAVTPTHATVLAPVTDDVHAGVAVLTNTALWSAITDCMTGYPRTVHSVCTDTGMRALSFVNWRSEIRAKLAVDGGLIARGVLVHLAIAAGNLDVLKTLHSLGTRFAHYRLSAELAFDQATRCSVLLSRVDVLQWLAELKALDPDSWSCEPNLLDLAMLNAKDTSVDVLEWINVHAPHETSTLMTGLMQFCACEGRLDLVQWLHEHGCHIMESVLRGAAENGHADVLQYLYGHSDFWCDYKGVNNAARNGHLDVIKLVVATQDTETTEMGLKYAAREGHLPIVQFYVESKILRFAARVIDYAAESGNLALIQYLHALYPDSGCTTHAMDIAAVRGHLEVIQFLHEHRTEGCSSQVLELAIQHSGVAVVQFLHEHYPHLTYPPSSYESAAANGHLDVIEYLHKHFPGATSPNALNKAAMSGRLHVIEFLRTHYPDIKLTPEAFDSAAEYGHLEVVKFLHKHSSEGCTSNALTSAVRRNHLEVVQFLCEHRSEGDVAAALREAEWHRRHSVVAYLRSRLPAPP